MFKKINIFLILLLLILSVTAVSAVDDLDGNVSSTDIDSGTVEVSDCQDNLLEDVTDEVLTVKEFTVTNSNYGDYFDDDGNLKNTVSAGDTLKFSGQFNKKHFNFNKTVNVVGDGSKMTNSMLTFLSGASGSSVANLNINNDESMTYGVFLNGASNCVIKNCVIYNTGGSSYPICLGNGALYNNVTDNHLKTSGISYGHGTRSTPTLLVSGSHHNYLANNELEMDDANGIYLSSYNGGPLSGGDSNYNEIFNNTIKYNVLPTSWSYAIQVMGGNNKIKSNKIIGAYRGISTSGPNNIISDNMIINLTGADYNNNNVPVGGEFGIVGSFNSHIYNNQIINARLISTGSGISVIDESVVENNTVEVIDSGMGISAAGCDVIIRNNDISTEYGAGIHERDEGQGLLIVGNNITSVKGVGILIEKINSKRVPSNVTIINNIISTGNTYAIDASGVKEGTGVIEDNTVGKSKVKGPSGVYNPNKPSYKFNESRTYTINASNVDDYITINGDLIGIEDGDILKFEGTFSNKVIYVNKAIKITGNATFLNSTFKVTSGGVWIENLTIINKNAERLNAWGIYINQANGVKVINNVINVTDPNAAYAVYVLESTDVEVIDNELFSDGTYLTFTLLAYSCEDCIFKGNKINTLGTGVIYQYSPESSIEGKIFDVNGTEVCIDGNQVCIDGKTYCLDGGEVCIDGKTYCLDGNELIVNGVSYQIIGGEVCIDGVTYNFDGENLTSQNQTYCLDGNNEVCIDGKTYCLDGSEFVLKDKYSIVNNEVCIDGKTYCLDGNNLVEKITYLINGSEVCIDGATYCIEGGMFILKEDNTKNYTIVNNEVCIDGKVYTLTANEVCVDGVPYVIDENNEVCIGDQVYCLDGTWFVVKNRYNIVNNEVCIDGKTYCLDGNNLVEKITYIINGTEVCIDGVTYCLDGNELVSTQDNTRYQIADGEVCIDGKTYTINGTAVCIDGVTYCLDGGEVCIDGKTYCLDGNELVVNNASYVRTNHIVPEIYRTYGILLLYSSNNEVSGNDVTVTSKLDNVYSSENSIVGIDIYYNSHNNNVSNNNIQVSGYDNCIYGAGVLGSKANHNAPQGQGASGNQFIDNTIFLGGPYITTGLIVGDECEATVLKDNYVILSSPLAYGVNLEGSHETTINNNYFSLNSDVAYGIEAYNSNYNVIEENNIDASGKMVYGIISSGSNNVIVNNNIVANGTGENVSIPNRDSLGRGNAGIYLSGNSTNTQIESNNVTSQTGYAIVCEAGGNTIKNNCFISEKGTGNDAINGTAGNVIEDNYRYVAVGSIENAQIPYLCNGNITLNVQDPEGGSVDGAVVDFYDGDGNLIGTATVSNQKATISYSLDESYEVYNQYRIRAVLHKENFKVSEFESDKLFVILGNLNVVVADVSVKEGLRGKFTATVTNGLGKPVSGLAVDFYNYDTGNQQAWRTAKTDPNGVATIIYLIENDFESDFGKITNITAVVRESVHYASSNGVGKLTILEIAPIDIEMKSKLSYNSVLATVTDNNGLAVANKAVTVTVDGKVFNTKTNANGEVILPSVSAGIHTITVSSAKDTIYDSKSVSSKVTVVAPISGNKNVNVYFGNTATYKIRLADKNGNYLSKKSVSIKVNGKTVKGTTDKNGYFTYSVKKVGTYKITAENNGYKVSNKIVIKPTLTAKDISKKKAKKIKFSVKVVNKKGKAVSKKKVTFKIKGKKYTAKTNKKGVATVTLKNLKVGKYSITSSYGGCTIKNTIKIKK